MENEVDIEKVYEEMLLYYRELENNQPVITTRIRADTLGTSNYATTSRGPKLALGVAAAMVPTTNKLVRSNSVSRFVTLYENK